jgi:hypothetical protein
LPTVLRLRSGKIASTENIVGYFPEEFSQSQRLVVDKICRLGIYKQLFFSSDNNQGIKLDNILVLDMGAGYPDRMKL